MECPLKTNGDARIFVWHPHKENGDAHMQYSQKDKGEETQGISVTFTQRKVGQFHSEKEAKRCGSPHKVRAMYEIKGNYEEVYS